MSKQPYAYAKRGPNGRWYHWTKLIARGAAWGTGFWLAKWLLGDFYILGDLMGDIISEIRAVWRAER